MQGGGRKGREALRWQLGRETEGAGRRAEGKVASGGVAAQDQASAASEQTGGERWMGLGFVRST